MMDDKILISGILAARSITLAVAQPLVAPIQSEGKVPPPPPPAGQVPPLPPTEGNAPLPHGNLFG